NKHSQLPSLPPCRRGTCSPTAFPSGCGMCYDGRAMRERKSQEPLYDRTYTLRDTAQTVSPGCGPLPGGAGSPRPTQCSCDKRPGAWHQSCPAPGHPRTLDRGTPSVLTSTCTAPGCRTTGEPGFLC